MNYPCPLELADLQNGSSRCSDDSSIFVDAVGTFILSCVVPHGWAFVPTSRRFWRAYTSYGWGRRVLEESRRMASLAIALNEKTTELHGVNQKLAILDRELGN